jgi:hypothetical protein
MATEDNERREFPSYHEPTTSREVSFDNLASGLANGEVSRRRALRMLASALVGAALASVPGVAWAAPCPRPQVRCRRACCPAGASCVSGLCTCPADAPTVCNNRCVDTLTDSLNCGGCGNVCPSGQGCTEGRCLDFCPAPPVRCDECACTDNVTGHTTIMCGITACNITLQCESVCPSGTTARFTGAIAPCVVSGGETTVCIQPPGGPFPGAPGFTWKSFCGYAPCAPPPSI